MTFPFDPEIQVTHKASLSLPGSDVAVSGGPFAFCGVTTMFGVTTISSEFPENNHSEVLIDEFITWEVWNFRVALPVGSYQSYGFLFVERTSANVI